MYTWADHPTKLNYNCTFPPSVSLLCYLQKFSQPRSRRCWVIASWLRWPGVFPFHQSTGNSGGDRCGCISCCHGRHSGCHSDGQAAKQGHRIYRKDAAALFQKLKATRTTYSPFLLQRVMWQKSHNDIIIYVKPDVQYTNMTWKSITSSKSEQLHISDVDENAWFHTKSSLPLTTQCQL